MLRQPVFDGLRSLTAWVGACDANPPACLKLPAPTPVRVSLCRAGGRGRPPRERLQDAVVGSDRVRSAHDPRARRQLQGERDLPASCFYPGSCVQTLIASCLSRRWPGMRRTTTRTRPNRSGGKWRSTSGATQNSSAPSWRHWVFPGRRACRGSPGPPVDVTCVFGPDSEAPVRTQIFGASGDEL